MNRIFSVALIAVTTQVSAVSLEVFGKQLAQVNQAGTCTGGNCGVAGDSCGPGGCYTVGTYYNVVAAIPAGACAELVCTGGTCGWHAAGTCAAGMPKAESAIAAGQQAAVMADGKLHVCTTGDCSGGACPAGGCDFTEVQNSDGSKTLTYTNGDVKTVHTDGSSTMVRADGFTREEAGGSIFETWPDGSSQVTDANGNTTNIDP